MAHHPRADDRDVLYPIWFHIPIYSCQFRCLKSP
jgi:hypothetical protein